MNNNEKTKLLLREIEHTEQQLAKHPIGSTMRIVLNTRLEQLKYRAALAAQAGLVKR